MGVGTQKIEGRFDVRNVTKPIVAARQVTDRGQGVWLNGDGWFILDVKSALRNCWETNVVLLSCVCDSL